MSKRSDLDSPGRSERARAAQSWRARLAGSGVPWILPAIILVVGLVYFSMFYTGYVSLLDWNGFILSPSEFIGLENYTALVKDPVFWGALGHTVVFFIVTFVLQTAIGFTFAAIMHSEVKLGALYKVIIFVPTVLAPATMAPVFRSIFDANGQFNDMLTAVGLDSLVQPWLANETTAMVVVMLVTVWQWTGLTFILFYAAMGQIEPEVLEAARLDGAGNLRVLWAMVWPQCRATTMALATLAVIGALKTFDVPYLITKGGPNHGTEFLGTYIYQTMVQEKHFGYAAAISVALLVLAIAGGVLTRLRRKNGA